MSSNVIPLPVKLPVKSPVKSPVETITAFSNSSPKKANTQVSFDRKELNLILSVYGQMVSRGDWKDYAIDMLKDKAVFSIFRRATETPLYRVVKTPALKDKQGAFSVIAPGGLILKRGHELVSVLKVFDKQRFRPR